VKFRQILARHFRHARRRPDPVSDFRSVLGPYSNSETRASASHRSVLSGINRGELQLLLPLESASGNDGFRNYIR